MSQDSLAYYSNRIGFVEELVNSFDADVDEPHPEQLQTQEDLKALVTRWRILAEGEVVTGDDLATIRHLRQDLRAIFESAEESVAASQLNALIERAPVASALHPSGDGDWHLKVHADPGLPLAQRVAVEAALGLAEAIEEYGFARLSVCEADPCRDVFLDISRNRSRRYCGPKCANRHNVAAFRQRQRT